MKTISCTNMNSNLPYVALRAFEMVVRKSGFSAAADELGVSQSAVSQHVKMLETWLGAELLIRGARRSAPTSEGRVLARTVEESLGRIDEVCNDIRRKKYRNNNLVVCCPPGFAFTWLFPRVLDFDLKHPEISLSISTDTTDDSRLPDNADVGIRYGLGEFSGLYSEHLMSEEIFPVCAPHMLPDASTREAKAEHLQGLTLLMDEYGNKSGTPPDWHFWARSCGMQLPSRTRTRSFAQSNLVIQAAIQGLGIAMGRGPLVAQALKDGKLVRPFSHCARSPYSYWLVCPHSAHEYPQLQSFFLWIQNQTAEAGYATQMPSDLT